jgi:hypothetical protein
MLFCDEKVCDTYQNTITGPSILTISSQRPVLTCNEHGKEIADVSFIRRPGRLGQTDTHAHYWHCFECGSGLKDHRSFDSNEVIWSHLKSIHSYIIDDYPGLS